MKKSALISAVAAAVMAATAYGQSSASMPGTSPSQGAGAASFTTLDANRDGRISQTEAAMHTELSGAFSTADANSDGALTQSEFTKWSSKSAPDTDKGSSKSNSTETDVEETSSSNTSSTSSSSASSPSTTPGSDSRR
jgi:hypothetical protein